MTFEEIKKIQIQDFSTASSQKMFLLHYKDVFLETGMEVVDLLVFIRRYDSETQAVDEYIRMTDGKYDRDLVRDFLVQLRAKLDPSHDDRKSENQVFLYQKELISPEMIAGYTHVFRFLFRPGIMLTVALVFIALEAYFFSNVLFELSVPHIDLYTVGGLVLFFVFSSLIHELGHASACRYFGVQHGGIGFGLYINIPVFYTDVSKVWKLPRVQRCVVNLAGVYFQAILLIPFLVAYMYTYGDLIKYMIFIANLNFLVTLNPFFKFDGYWLMTDMLGVPNLRKRGNECIRYYWNRFRGKVVDRKPYLLSLKQGGKIVFVIYTTIVNLFFAYYFFYWVPLFIVRFCRTFPDKFTRLLTELMNRQMPDWANLQQMFVQLLFLGLTVYMVYRAVSPFIRKKKRAE